jgi:HEAT repeats
VAPLQFPQQNRAVDSFASGAAEMATIVILPIASDVHRAIGRLKSLHDGDLGVLDVVACGRRAIPALRTLLLEGKSSGIYQPRCRAVEALAALGAHDVLIEFLKSPREVADPVNRTGEEAVISAAARALADFRDKRVFPLLLELAERQPLAGAIDALGSFRRPEAIPCLIRALSEDYSRRAAEAALLQLGSKARSALLKAAMRPLPSAEWESPSSCRARRSAVQLLARLGVSPRQRQQVHDLMNDRDAEVALHACRAYLALASAEEKPVAIRRVVDLIPCLGWMLGVEAEACILDHLESAREIIGEFMQEGPPEPANQSPRAQIHRSLHRIVQRAGAMSH